jgi:hypothetical protein
MGAPGRLIAIRHAAMAALAVCASWGSPAWAGGGGADAGNIQSFLDSTCGLLGMSVCPQLPTITQGILEVAGLQYARPEALRSSQNIGPGAVYAGNPSPIPASPPVAAALPISALDFAKLGLTPLAFATHSNQDDSNARTTGVGFAAATQLFGSEADSFFYAVTTYDLVGGAAQPHALNLFYEDLFRDNHSFTNGQIVAQISLPLAVYNSSTPSQREVPTLLRIHAICTGGPTCLAADAIGDFAGTSTPQTRSAAAIGVKFALVFGPSSTSSHPHAIFEVQTPLLVTFAYDPVYFSTASNQEFVVQHVSFVNEDTGFALGGGNSIGVATYPAPMTVLTGNPPAPAPTANFGFCANLPDNSNGPNAHHFPAVAAFLQIASDGETLASAPLGPSTAPTLKCPF